MKILTALRDATRLSCLAMLLLLGIARAQAGDANMEYPNTVVTVAREGYTIAGLVTHLAEHRAFRYGIVLFPGYPGIMRLHEEDSVPKFEMRGNFLVRSRRHWLDDETLVVVVDAPSDQWAGFAQWFREKPRYGEDVLALLQEVGRRYRGITDWTFVGTSEGTVSAYHAARMNPQLAKRTILTSSLFQSSRNGPGLSGVAWDGFPGELLWVHHENGPCLYTAYRDAQDFSRKSGKPLVTVRGGGLGHGSPCEAYSQHGYVGVERETVLAMRAWVKTGTVPEDVKP
ncbi:MAG TPA: hypothetical protein VF450_02140 [Noviherbaspirillum sp.]